ncbi:MAG TPA: tetratricopeptide repeat protein [Candidatus Melainabacteria bacterium]|nr:tetratricopeptide repeat protein [Candidatus Melainabacteria bacterium]
MRIISVTLAIALTISLAPLATAKEKQPLNSDWRTAYVEGERKLKTQELEAAEAAFAEALRNVKNNKNASPDDIALCYQSLASAHYQRDRFYELVVPFYKKAIATLEKAYGKETPKLAAPLTAYAAVREDEGDYKSAQKLLARAVAIVEKSDGKNSLSYAEHLHRLGRVNFKLGLPVKAEQMYFQSLVVLMSQKVLPSSEIIEQNLADYIDLLTKVENRGKTFNSAFQKELLKDSTASVDRTQAVSASVFNKEVSSRLANAPDFADSSEENRIFDSKPAAPAITRITPDRPMSDFAALEEINKQRVAFYERMISTDILSLGADHPSVARDLSGLASLYMSQRKFDEAKPLLLKALAIYEKSYTSESSMIQRTKALLQLIEDEKNPQTAAGSILITDYTAALPGLPLAAQKLEIALRLNRLAFMNYCQGKMANAEQIYTWAVASTAKSAGEKSLLAASCLFDFSRVLRSTGKQADAEAMDNTAQAILRRSISQNAARSLP